MNTPTQPQQRRLQIGAISLVAIGFVLLTTVIAMSLRTLVWVTIAAVAWRGAR